MSYLDRLDQLKLEKRPTSLLPKLPKDPSDSFGSTYIAHFQKLKPSRNELPEPLKALILKWVAHIGENDQTSIDELLEDCRADPRALAQCLDLIRGTRSMPTDGEQEDNRRSCRQCRYLSGELCTNRANPLYRSSPCRDRPRRCEWFAPLPNDPDQRPAQVRWKS